MKSIYDRKSQVMAGAVLSADFAAIVALCVVMLAGLFSWSLHAPVFRPDRGAVPAIEETMPWSN